ncbi:hypothetical protein DFQ27_005739 [Actinomortierella ambigua]|uniref:TLDc domain-containing protein n=1 Tax=Actinomortierella ambigua TaxID=1343610 RepID=A0A9P6PY27_9FUNG|nr:hypothetical protein DFQ27_005739 [Actinomortierella ambigua]
MAKDAELRKIYLASKHGFSAEAFHKHCDKQGPTLTVARTSTGYVVGGYNEASWFSDRQYHYGDTNFLFQYNPETHLLLQGTLITRYKHRASGNKEFTGPSFGGDSVMPKPGISPSYNNSQFCYLMSFTVTDYEVFKILLIL